MESNKNLDRIEIILCNTQNAANIGSVCRAMKTMGLTHLTLVTDCDYDENRVNTLALHAKDVYASRKTFLRLDDAIKDSVLAIASTRRHGKNRKYTSFTPEEVAEKISSFKEGKISVVFGCEANGLSDAQVELCNAVLTIPTSPLFPSLNLAQAVQIVCYSLYTRLKEFKSGGFCITTKRASEAAGSCVQSLKEMDYFKLEDEEIFTAEFLKDVFSRASLSENEVKRMEKIFKKASLISTHKTAKQ